MASAEEAVVDLAGAEKEEAVETTTEVSTEAEEVTEATTEAEETSIEIDSMYNYKIACMMVENSIIDLNLWKI